MRLCAWCDGQLNATARADAVTCSKRCRQARHRFNRDAERKATHEPARPMRFGYADPPYPGKAGLYRGHADYGGEVDHTRLLEQLVTPGRYDGWALSTSAAALPDILGICVALGQPVRVAAWVRGAQPHDNPHGPVCGWEPVVFAGGRHGSYRVDTLVHANRARRADPRYLIGAKPAKFAAWLFDLFGACPGDEFDDLFPGSGGMSRAWAVYTSHEDLGDGSGTPAKVPEPG